MNAIVIEKFGGPESLVTKDVPILEPKQGEVAEWIPISGIECVGIVSSCLGGDFKEGTPVASLMVGLGRTIDGSYAEYTRVRVPNVVAVGPAAEELRWDQLAAIPASYAMVWTCLFRNLEISALSDVPLPEVVAMVARKQFNEDPWQVFRFEEIQQAHRLMENNEGHGKMVIKVD